MLINLFRTVILYALIVFSMRLLGKRQIGELQPAELVGTILLSEILAIPMQDTRLPLMATIVPVLILIGFEIIISVINLKSIKFRSVMQGNSVMIIKNGVLDQGLLKDLRFTVDDLLEELRKKDVFDISTVQYAIVETDGSLSVMLKSQEENVKIKDLNISKSENTLKYVVVSDGRLIEKNFADCNMSRQKVEKILRKKNIDIKNVMLMSIDENGSFTITERDKNI